ncbi:hypothetical protein H206_05641 [Candidatus Electrothrix aarhusensis]|uniref:Uncharacterized protein n=1 Tax=Candidatus Electrothrix aarhusensis TaxID=1859131 RepID=A0A444J3N3_9BACT|nr:hypothetical protein H206_05641 [Candidatus Electrothrix aarhusensis]
MISPAAKPEGSSSKPSVSVSVVVVSLTPLAVSVLKAISFNASL